MSKNKFYKSLIGLSASMALALFLLSFIPIFREHQVFSWLNLLFFILFTLSVYIIAEKASQSPNLSTFSSVILGVIFIKMIFIIIIVLIYREMTNPGSGGGFLGPFFLIYVVFTIFEVYFMMKLARVKPPKRENSEIQSSSK